MIKNITILILGLSLTLNWFTIDNQFTAFAYTNLNLIPKWAFSFVDILAFTVFWGLFFSKANKDILDKNFMLVIFYFSVLYSLIAFYFEANIFQVLLGLRNYLSFLPMYYLGSYFAKKDYNLKAVFNFYMIFFLVQIPIVILQYYKALQLIGIYQGTVFDLVTGTLGGLSSSVLNTLIFSYICFIISFSYIYNQVKYFYSIPIFLIPTILSESKYSFILILFLFGFFIKNIKVELSKKIISSVIGIIIIIVFVFGYQNYIGYRFDFFSIDSYISYETTNSVDSRLGRGESLSNSLNKINNSLLSLNFGFGIGNASKNSLSGIDPKYYNFLEDRHFYDKLLKETGLLGLSIFIGVMLFHLRKYYINYLHNEDPEIRFLTLSLIGTILISMIGNLMTDLFNRVQFIYSFSFFMGYLNYSLKLNKNKL